MKAALRAAALGVAALCCAVSLEASAGPRVCLVLSGGGARGAAHIGVLKVLEELHVPVDCITATSMGSIVGGAYASGLPLGEMQSLVGDISTARLFVERPPRQDLSMRRKLDDRSILFGLELGVDEEGVKLPKGIVSGVQLETVLRSLVRMPGYQDFDKLPIPFRAVATDLETGKAVVIHDGEIAQAMRASMSVPGAVAPAEQGGRILVDGGLTDNLPVDVARAMGAEIVIAVNLGTPLLKREALSSALGVSAQMINILTEQNVQASLRSLKPTDILIEPELGDFSAGDFDSLPKTIPIGEAAARKVEARLKALAVSPDQYAAFQAARTKPANEAVVVDEIRFAPMQRVNPEVARSSMDTTVEKPVESAVIDNDLRRMYGSGDFERVGYSIVEERGRRVLIVNAVEKSWGPDYLRFGLGLGSDFKGDDFFNAAASYRKTWINPLGAEWRTDLQVGSQSFAVSEFYQPLFVNRALFIAPRIELGRRTQDIYQGNDRLARVNVRERLAGLDIGSEWTRFGELRLGIVGGQLDLSQQTGPPNFVNPSGRIDQGAYTARLRFDQLDSANFPRSGYAGRFEAFDSSKSLGADVPYTRLEADAIAAFSVGRHTFSVAARGGDRGSSDPIPGYDQFVWGGFLQQSGYARGAITVQRMAFGRAVYTYRLGAQKLFEGAYAGFSLEGGHYSDPLVRGSPSGTLKSGSIFVAMDTPIGPVYLGYGTTSNGNNAAYFYLGRP